VTLPKGFGGVLGEFELPKKIGRSNAASSEGKLGTEVGRKENEGEGFGDQSLYFGVKLRDMHKTSLGGEHASYAEL
jgi:hypothetical protein